VKTFQTPNQIKPNQLVLERKGAAFIGRPTPSLSTWINVIAAGGVSKSGCGGRASALTARCRRRSVVWFIAVKPSQHTKLPYPGQLGSAAGSLAPCRPAGSCGRLPEFWAACRSIVAGCRIAFPARLPATALFRSPRGGRTWQVRRGSWWTSVGPLSTKNVVPTPGSAVSTVFAKGVPSSNYFSSNFAP